MSSKDKGKDFLFSSDCGFIKGEDGESYKYSDGSGYYHGKDGSESYIYSDGSGYYHGADGSEGYIYSDGSAYYHGADGSDGHKYSDGSGYFNGADGSRGNKYSDGSGSYQDGSGNSSYYDADDDDGDDDSDDSGASWGDILGSIIEAGLAGLTAAAIAQQQEEERKQREKAARRKAFCKRHWKAIFLCVLAFVLAIVVAVGIWEFRKMIPMGSNSDELLGQNYEEVVEILTVAGFTNIHTEGTEDLSYAEISEEGNVYQIYIFGKNEFAADSKFPYDLPITVKYHAAKLITLPISSKAANGMNYNEVVDLFEKAGFVNISVEAKYDIITGWLTDDGEVEKITVNGSKKFSESDRYRPDAEIVMTYHTFLKNKK